MKNRSTWIRLLAFAALLPLAACGVDDEGDMEMTEDDPMMEEPMTPAESGDMMEPMTVDFEAKNESGVTGEATVRHEGASVTVEVSVNGVQDEGELPAHIHSGTCDSTGGVLVPLTPLQASGGSGMSVTTLASSEVGEDQESVIQVHGSDGAPIACADIRGHGESGSMGEVDEMGDTTGM